MTKAARAAPSAEQQSLWGGWNHVVRRGRVVTATPTPHPQPSLKPATAPEETRVAGPVKKVGKTSKPRAKKVQATGTNEKAATPKFIAKVSALIQSTQSPL